MEEKKPAWFYVLIKSLVRFFAPKFKTSGVENVPAEPCIIVGNHAQIYGPIVAELYVPRKAEIWCNSEMMDRKEVPAYAFQDFWAEKPKWIRWFYKLLSHLMAPLSEFIFTNADTIPVYRDTRIMTTFRSSVEALSRGRDLVIFPECRTRHNNVVYEFQDRFIDVARLYCRQAGKPLSFVPVYISPKLKKVCFGTPIAYDPTAKPAEERVRICTALMDAVTELAAALPEHRVTPYVNLPKRDYPMNRPVVVYEEKSAEKVQTSEEEHHHVETAR